MSEELSRKRTRVGIVGGGQLARMMIEASDAAGVDVVVLGEHDDDSAAPLAFEFELGSPKDPEALARLASKVDVITFDHELVDLDQLQALEASVTVLPSPRALNYAVDKAFQRGEFSRAGIPVPRFLVTRDATEAPVATFLRSLSGPPVLKSARGGYDGRGVEFPATMEETLERLRALALHGDVVIEERLDLEGEVSQIVVRDVQGNHEFYPVVDSVQRNGMCSEVSYPSHLSTTRLSEVRSVSQRVSDVVQGVGVMAIEYLVSKEGIFVNEIALRPHNTGHWSIEGCATSQFEEHLLAVSGKSLGPTTPTVPAAVMVNVVGGDVEGSLQLAESVPGVVVHDYAKAWRPGRKLGHVSAVGDDVSELRVRAWTSARLYGTALEEE